MNKSTEELLKTLKHSAGIASYLTQEQENLTALPLHLYLEKLFAETNIPASTEPTVTRFFLEKSSLPVTKSWHCALAFGWILRKPSVC